MLPTVSRQANALTKSRNHRDTTIAIQKAIKNAVRVMLGSSNMCLINFFISYNFMGLLD